MYKVVFFAPESCKERVKQAMFAAGAGKLGDYDQCSFEVKGIGQFRPLDGSHPAIGEQDKLELVEEYRVEMICGEDCLQKVINALVDAHDYEVPAYDVMKLVEVVHD